MKDKKYDYKRRASAEYKYFFFDPEGEGLIFFRDEAELMEYAKISVEDYLDNVDGWAEEVEELCSGVVTRIVKKTDPQRRSGEVDAEGYDKDGVWWGMECEERCNYELLPLEEK